MSESPSLSENITPSNQEVEKDVKEERKIDVKKLVSVVPPPTSLFSRQTSSVKEKRLRLKYDSSVKEGEAKVSSALARELGIKEYIEITVAGKKRFKLKTIVVDGLDTNYVNVNPDQMKRLGIANNSICTIRSI